VLTAWPQGDVRRTSSTFATKLRRLTQTTAANDAAANEDGDAQSLKTPTTSMATSPSSQTLKKSATTQLLLDMYKQVRRALQCAHHSHR